MMTDACDHYTEWATPVSAMLGELVDMGFYDYTEPSWRFDTGGDDEWYMDLCRKFTRRYYFRQIGVTPLGRFKMAYLEKLAEIMPKYIPLHERIKQGINPFQESSEYGKSRNVYSEFPQTLLNGNSDYASTGTDREFETIREGDPAQKAMEYAKLYNDVDVMILDELEFLFSCFITVDFPRF